MSRRTLRSLQTPRRRRLLIGREFSPCRFSRGAYRKTAKPRIGLLRSRMSGELESWRTNSRSRSSWPSHLD